MNRNVLTSVVLALLLLATAAAKVSAQGSNEGPGNPTLLQAIQNLQSSVNTLQSTVQGLQTSVGGISSIENALTALQQSVDNVSAPNQSNVRLTPPVDVAATGDLATCAAVNVSTQPRTIRTQILDVNGQVAEDLGNLQVQPGKVTGGGNRTGAFFYCKFTVVDGTRADIRGAMSVCTATECKQTVLAE